MKIPQIRFPGFNEEWGEDTLGNLARNKLSNGVFNDPNKVGSGYRLVNVKDMYVDGFIDELALTRVAINQEEFSRNKVEYGDIFFTRSSLVKEGIAYTNIYFGSSPDITFDGHLIKMSPDTNNNSPVFIYYLTKTTEARKQLVRFGTTTTMTTIGQKEVASVLLALPPKTEQEKIAGFLGAVDEKIGLLSKKKELLEKYKKGVMQQIFSQKIRFKDENGQDYPAWQNYSFEDCLSSVSTKKYQIQNSEINTVGTHPVVDQGQSKIAGYTDNSKKIFKDIPVVVFGDHTTFLKYVDFNFVVGADGTKILKARKGNLKYLFYFLQHYKLAPEGYKRHYSTLKLLIIWFPHCEEQDKIADYLSTIDTKIEAEERKLEKAKEFKKALLQQMFV